MKKPSLKSLPKKPFVIFAAPRTGSYLLVSLLDQFPGIKCYGEVFTKSKIELPPKKLERMKATVESRNAEPVVFLNRLFKMTSEEHTGFKFFFNHHALLRKWLVNSGSINRVIISRNPFDMYVSQCRAIATGVWIKKKGGAATQEKPPLLKFDPEDFEKRIGRIDSNRKRMLKIAAKQPDSTITITYDEISAIEPVRRIAEFLGASAQPEVLKVELQKQTTERYSELFEDFDKVREYVSSKHPDLVIDNNKI